MLDVPVSFALISFIWIQFDTHLMWSLTHHCWNGRMCNDLSELVSRNPRVDLWRHMRCTSGRTASRSHMRSRRLLWLVVLTQEVSTHTCKWLYFVKTVQLRVYLLFETIRVFIVICDVLFDKRGLLYCTCNNIGPNDGKQKTEYSSNRFFTILYFLTSMFRDRLPSDYDSRRFRYERICKSSSREENNTVGILRQIAKSFYKWLVFINAIFFIFLSKCILTTTFLFSTTNSNTQNSDSIIYKSVLSRHSSKNSKN